MFSIQFEKDIAGSTDKRLSRATIQINEFIEPLEVSIEYWNRKDYQEHWIDSISHIINGESKSCLITSIVDPSVANFLFWWPIYRLGDRVRFQNQILFLDELSPPFDERHPYRYVPERATHTEEGGIISEWDTSIDGLEHWLKSVAN